MKHIFIDEFIGRSNKNIFGLSFIIINNRHYNGICTKFLAAMKDLEWPEECEFKGRYLFSGLSDKGNKEKIISVDKTIEFIKKSVEFLSGKTNSKCEIIRVFNNKGNNFQNYCLLLEEGINKIKKHSINKKAILDGKCNASLFYDGFSEGWQKNHINKIANIASDALEKRGYFLVEKRVTPVDSHNSCVGVCYADILAYLVCWKIETPNFESVEESQLNLFDYQESATQLKKIAVVSEIIDLLKSKSI